MFVSFQFQYLKKKSGIYLRDGTYPAKEGEKKINRAKNRYKDILPCKFNKKIITDISGTVKSKKRVDIEYLSTIVDPSTDIKRK